MILNDADDVINQIVTDDNCHDHPDVSLLDPDCYYNECAVGQCHSSANNPDFISWWYLNKTKPSDGLRSLDLTSLRCLVVRHRVDMWLDNSQTESYAWEGQIVMGEPVIMMNRLDLLAELEGWHMFESKEDWERRMDTVEDWQKVALQSEHE